MAVGSAEEVLDALEAGERAHILTIGSPARTAFRVARGSLDAHGRWHPNRPDVFVIWRGFRRSGPELRDRAREAFQVWAASRLPRWLVYRAAIRLGAEVTTGRYGSTVVPELTLLEAIERWGDV